ncbi:hypothetical protein LWI29_025121 [Acer saccharum]|uniref:Apple domain-containing protein n=1 Tax=Acer saccharum TaxID=4024 RepID=A0AA39RJ37_ACESA|nr:hypothetical protein LWI29_025121 [Acer saccharum]KAK1553409.1 hypothetical protein Q3G72_034453 [Acer saccharum]
MARVEWGYQGRGKWNCSYKKITLIVCSINIVIALYVLHTLYASIYVHSNTDFNNAVKYTPDQIEKMEESIRIRRAKEPIQLVKIVKKLKLELSREDSVLELLPQPVKQRMADEILQRLHSLDAKTNVSAVREAVESWHRQKLKEAKHLSIGKQGMNLTILKEQTRLLVKALESDWAALSEEIGLWIPAEIFHQEHDDKPEGVKEEEEKDILPGRPVPPECNAELHTDYAGAAVRWGLTHPKESAADCCQACLDQAKRAQPGQIKCNTWVYCPSEIGCHSPDIYEHKNQECWLKYAEQPKINFKGKYPDSYRHSHPTAPLIVPWVSGVVRV